MRSLADLIMSTRSTAVTQSRYNVFHVMFSNNTASCEIRDFNTLLVVPGQNESRSAVQERSRDFYDYHRILPRLPAPRKTFNKKKKCRRNCLESASIKGEEQTQTLLMTDRKWNATANRCYKSRYV